jgi:hypothetical protein
MSFEVGHFFIAKGASVFGTYRWVPHGVGVDKGAQWIMATPLPFETFPMPSGITQLESGRFQKRFTFENGGMDWSYWALVQNTAGPGFGHNTFAKLQGGGNT